MYEQEVEYRRYTGRIGENCVEFVTWNYALGIKRSDKDKKRRPGLPDFEAWFKAADPETGDGGRKYGIEAKTKSSVENCVIDDKVLYNLICTQTYHNEDREEVLIVFLFWDIQKLYYITLLELIGNCSIDVSHDWSAEILSPDGKVINQILLDKIDAQLLAICDGVSELTKRYKSKQVNLVFEIDFNRLHRYPYHFLKKNKFCEKAKLESSELLSFAQYYLETRDLLKTKHISIIWHNVQKIKRRAIDYSKQLDFLL